MGHEAAEEHIVVKANAIVLLVAVVISLTLAFELGYGKLVAGLRKHSPQLLVLVDTLMRVLTVLGFVGLSLFMLIFSGAVQALNDKYLGEGEVELIGKHELSEEGESPVFAPTELAEGLEAIQINILIIMAITISLATVAIIAGISFKKTWKSWESMRFEELRHRMSLPRWSESLCRFVALRERFMHRHRPFGCRPKYAEDFSFAEYLGAAYSKTIISIVSMRLSTYYGLLMGLLLTFPIFLIESDAQYSLIRFCLSAYIFAFLFYFFYRCSALLHLLHPPLESVRDTILASYSYESLTNQLVMAIKLESQDFIKRNNGFMTFVYGSKICNAQEHCLPFGAKGRKILPRIFQLLLIYQVILFTLTLHNAFNQDEAPAISPLVAATNPLPSMVTSSEACQIVFDILSMLLFFLALLFLWPALITRYTLVSHLEFFSDPELITIQDQRVEKKRKQRMNFLGDQFLFLLKKNILAGGPLFPSRHITQTPRAGANNQLRAGGMSQTPRAGGSRASPRAGDASHTPRGQSPSPRSPASPLPATGPTITNAMTPGLASLSPRALSKSQTLLLGLSEEEMRRFEESRRADTNLLDEDETDKYAIALSIFASLPAQTRAQIQEVHQRLFLPMDEWTPEIEKNWVEPQKLSRILNVPHQLMDVFPMGRRPSLQSATSQTAVGESFLSENLNYSWQA